MVVGEFGGSQECCKTTARHVECFGAHPPLIFCDAQLFDPTRSNNEIVHGWFAP